jgi:hypothetical protein
MADPDQAAPPGRAPGADELALIPRCIVCDAAATDACPRCRRPLCDAHRPAIEARCPLCEADYAGQLRRSSVGRAAGTAAGVLAGSFLSGVLMILLYMLLGILFGIGPDHLWFLIMLLAELGGAYGGALVTHRMLEARQRSLFLADHAPELPEARLL